MRDPFPSPPRVVADLARPLAHSLGLSTLPDHVHEIAFAFLLYNFIFFAVSPALAHKFARKTYLSLPHRSQVEWHVRTVSQLQAIAILCCAVYLIAADEERARADWRGRLWGYDGATGMVQAFAAGYFLWDVQVSTVHFEVLGVGSLVHAVGALAVTCLGFRPFANYYGLNFILYEVSTPFLNAHWWFDKFQMTGSKAQLVNGIVLIATFGCSRLLWGTYQSLCIYSDLWTAWSSGVPTDNTNSKIPSNSSQSGTMEIGGRALILPLWLAALYAGSNTVLSALNFYWFNRMIAAVQKRFPKDKTGGAGQTKKQR